MVLKTFYEVVYLLTSLKALVCVSEINDRRRENSFLEKNFICKDFIFDQQAGLFGGERT